MTIVTAISDKTSSGGGGRIALEVVVRLYVRRHQGRDKVADADTGSHEDRDCVCQHLLLLLLRIFNRRAWRILGGEAWLQSMSDYKGTLLVVALCKISTGQFIFHVPAVEQSFIGIIGKGKTING